MRKLTAITILCVLFLTLPALAADAPASSNAKRIAEIQTEMKQLIVDVQGLTQQKAQIDAAIADKQTEFTKRQGAVEELQRQDAEAAKKAQGPE